MYNENMNKKQKVCAIICEYNPMHTGHIYQIQKIKEKLPGCYILGLMSGNFSQRSMPCILNKQDRTEIALQNGIDAVVQIPTAFCIQNAEIFALSSIKILNSLKVDFLCFGMETPNEKALNTLTDFLLNETSDFKNTLKKHLNKGLNYNESLILTIKELSRIFEDEIREDVVKLISLPNNILAVEYVKALKRTNSRINYILVKRESDYNNAKLEEKFTSSSSIRKNILNFEKVKKFLPKNTEKYFQKYTINYTAFETIIHYNLKTISLNDLSEIYGITEGLENRIKFNASATSSFKDFQNLNSTRRYKESKINSIYLNALFKIDKKFINKFYTTKTNIYAKLLGLNSQKSDILSKINTKNLISRKNDAEKLLLKNNGFNNKIYEIENMANSLYNIISETQNLSENELFSKIIII